MVFDELREPYPEVILDRSRNPRNLRQPADVNREALGNNPLCGDLLTVYLSIGDDGVVWDAALVRKGCAISVASASLMTKILKGRTIGEAERLFNVFHLTCTRADLDRERGGPMAMLWSASACSLEYGDLPIRVERAALAWHTMTAAMSGNSEASTE